MSKNRKSLLPFLALAALLGIGALNRQPLFSTSPAETTPVPAPESAQGVWTTWATPAPEILANAQDRNGPNKLTWLRMNVWQRMRLTGIAFESDSRIVLGPARCANLRMKVLSGNGATVIQVVSDGKTIAKSVRTGPGAPNITTADFPPAHPGADASDPLAAEGCCSPGVLLARLVPRLKNLSVQKQERLVRIVGETISERCGFPLPSGRPLRCRMFFDEKSLWLTRIEWAIIEAGGERMFLEMEYRNPILNEPLTDEECIREFTFRSES